MGFRPVFPWEYELRMLAQLKSTCLNTIPSGDAIPYMKSCCLTKDVRNSSFSGLHSRSIASCDVGKVYIGCNPFKTDKRIVICNLLPHAMFTNGRPGKSVNVCKDSVYYLSLHRAQSK